MEMIVFPISCAMQRKGESNLYLGFSKILITVKLSHPPLQFMDILYAILHMPLILR